jgi:Transmembrane domain of unknown function (DUF3566)
VEHRAEPSWLPEGTTPDIPAAGTDTTGQPPGGEDAPYVPRQEGSYAYLQDGSLTQAQRGSYGEETVSESRFNQPTAAGGEDHPTSAYQASPGIASPGIPGVASPGVASPGVGGTSAGAGPMRHAPPSTGQAPFGSYRAKARPRQPAHPARRANLIISRLEPWSVMKFSFLMSLVAWVVLFVAVALLYYALAGLGVFAAIERAFQGVTGSQNSGGVNLSHWLSASRVLGYTMLIGAMNVILITALSTLGAVIYNLVSYLGRGIEITLKEPE